jgi:hypothetical protein
MTFSTGSHIGENDCPVILVNGVLFTVAPNPAVQFPMAATNSSYLQQKRPPQPRKKIDKCYLKMSELSSPNLRRISIPSTTDVVLV